jgi:hypothetical protein
MLFSTPEQSTAANPGSSVNPFPATAPPAVFNQQAGNVRGSLAVSFADNGETPYRAVPGDGANLSSGANLVIPTSFPLFHNLQWDHGDVTELDEQALMAESLSQTMLEEIYERKAIINAGLSRFLARDDESGENEMGYPYPGIRRPWNDGGAISGSSTITSAHLATMKDSAVSGIKISAGGNAHMMDPAQRRVLSQSWPPSVFGKCMNKRPIAPLHELRIQSVPVLDSHVVQKTNVEF